MIQWIEEDCPKCDKVCMVNNGDPNDLTDSDIDGIECWSCGHRWLLDGAEDWTDLESANIGESEEWKR